MQNAPWEQIADLSLLAALITGVLALADGMRQRRTDRLARENMWWIEFRRTQLSSLYGPLHLARQTSRSLRELLPAIEADGSRWRLVDHLLDITDDPEVTIVERILAVNDRMVDLLSQHAGLIEPIPETEAFHRFILHHEMLRLSWKTSTDLDPSRDFSFPGIAPFEQRDPCEGADVTPDTDFDCAIHAGLTSIQADLRRRLRVANA